MRLPHLDQKILLHWGEAEQLANAIGWVLCEQLDMRHPARPKGKMSLSMGPLNRVRNKLLGRQRVEKWHSGPRPRKPWKFTLYYDDVIALNYIMPIAPQAGEAWDQIFQARLYLEQYIDFEE